MQAIIACHWSGTSQPKPFEILSTCSWSWRRDNLTWWNFKSKAVFLSLLFLRDHTALLCAQFYFLLPILSIKAVCRLASWLVLHSNDHVCTREFCYCWHRSCWWHALVSQYKPESVRCFYFQTMKKHVLHCFSQRGQFPCPPILSWQSVTGWEYLVQESAPFKPFDYVVCSDWFPGFPSFFELFFPKSPFCCHSLWFPTVFLPTQPSVQSPSRPFLW